MKKWDENPESDATRPGHFCKCPECSRHWDADAAKRGELQGQQPKPVEGEEMVLGAVMLDLKGRAEAGKEKYGTFLKTYNGRVALQDAYEEALDLCMYLKQAIMEGKQ